MFVKSVLAKNVDTVWDIFHTTSKRDVVAIVKAKVPHSIEMHFISDIWVPCPVCEGARYNEAILEVTWNGRNIADVLDFSVDEAQEFFTAQRLSKVDSSPCNKLV